MSKIFFDQVKIFDFNTNEIKITGYKHLVVQVLCSTILFPEIEFTFYNIPNILDTEIILKILSYMGAEIQWNNDSLRLNTKNVTNKILPVEDTSQIHGALYLFPSLLGRFGKAAIGQTGGCSLIEKNQMGSRPFLHIKSVLEKFGSKVNVINEQMTAESLENNIEFIDIFDYSSCQTNLTGPYVSGACKTALLCALSLKPGSTFTIKNPYLKPDVVEFSKFLSLTNFIVKVEGDLLCVNTIERSQLAKKVDFIFMEDISTLMTYICLAVMFQKTLSVNLLDSKIIEDGLKEEIKLMRKMGLEPTFDNNRFYLPHYSKIQPLEIDVYSTGIYSDHQPFFALMLTKADSKSVIREHVWKTRFSYAKELNKLGYNFEIEDSMLTVYPSSPNHQPVTLQANDLRAAAVLSIAACLNKSETIVSGLDHLNRGYENLLEFLSTCGVKYREFA